METGDKCTVATEIEAWGFMLRASRNVHRSEMVRMGIADGPDPIGEALAEAVRCFEIVHGR